MVFNPGISKDRQYKRAINNTIEIINNKSTNNIKIIIE